MSEEEPNFLGHLNLDRHRTCGQRAWCDCGDWCRSYAPCYCCRENLADNDPCRACDGTGINKWLEVTALEAGKH